jgi:adenosylmethionine-8-amino-7-oxononanoate aminotransferase
MNKKKLLQLFDKKYLWHPFTQMNEWDDPLIIVSGNKAKLKDIDGKEYIDGVSSIWCNTHGHRNRTINAAIKRQIDKIAHSTLLGLSNIPSIELAKELVKISPPLLKKVFFSDDGATSVEVALKIAFQYWQNKGNKNKTKFIHLENSYHGDTIGAVSVGGIKLFHSKFSPLLFHSYEAPSYYCYRCKFNHENISTLDRFNLSTYFFSKKGECNFECVSILEEIVSKNHESIIGLIIEPIVQAAGGIIVAPHGYLKRVKEICSKYNILLIFDEVATGFGRTGKMFACEHENVSPDILCLSKGITGGYLPLAATLTTNEIYDAFLGEREEKTFFHGHTYTGNPICCSAALANLKIFEKEKVIKKLFSKIKLLREKLKNFCTLPIVGDVRQSGFIAGIELVKDKKTKESFSSKERVGYKICMALRKEGIILRPLSDVIVIMPPYCISDDELEYMLDKIYQKINSKL